MTETFKMTLGLLSSDAAGTGAREVLEKAKQGLGFAPNMYGAMANQPGLLESYSFGYNQFRQESGFTAAEQEVVFLTVSFENGCDYCMAAHSLVADKMSKVPLEVTEAIRNGQPATDPKLEALRGFTRIMVTKAGRPSPADVNAFLAVGYTEKHILAIILAIGVKTMSNYANHVFHTPVDAAFQSRAWKAPLRSAAE